MRLETLAGAHGAEAIAEHVTRLEWLERAVAQTGIPRLSEALLDAHARWPAGEVAAHRSGARLGRPWLHLLVDLL